MPDESADAESIGCAPDAVALRVALTELPILLVGFDASGTCTMQEGGLLARFGTAPGEAVGVDGRTFFERFPEGWEAVRRCLTGQSFVSRGVGRAGFPLDMYWRPIRRDGDVVGMTVLGTEVGGDFDASEIVRAEGEYRALLAAIPDHVFRMYRDGTMVTAKVANNTTTSPLPTAWTPLPVEDLMADQSARQLRDAAEEVLATGRERSLEQPLFADGGERFTEVRLIPVGDDEVLGIMRDVTDRKHLEAELRESSKMEALGRLSAGVAHEINTPIQFVSHNVEFMSEAFDAMHNLLIAYRSSLHSATSLPWDKRSAALLQAEKDADVEYLLGEVPMAVQETLDGVRRMASIVQAMQQFSHPSARELQAADLNEALRSAVVVSTSQHKRVAEVELDLGDIPAVVCVVGEITQVFLNLIVNAAQALESVADQRGVRGRIGLRTRVEGSHVVVSVADDGPGIPVADQAQIFDAFFTTKDVGKGTGQGLTLARAIVVDKHGGLLQLRSVPGEGTTFDIRLLIDGPPRPSGVTADIAGADL